MSRYQRAQERTSMGPVGGKKPWYKRWWAITLFAVVGLGIVGNLLDGGAVAEAEPQPTMTITTSPEPAPTITVTASPEPAPTVTITAAPEPAPTVTMTVTPDPAPAAITTPKTTPSVTESTKQNEPSANLERSSSVSYANCTEAREAGAAPIYRGEPGYAKKLDRDGDGVACE